MAKIAILFPEEGMMQDGIAAAGELSLEVAYSKAISIADAVNEARAAISAGAQIIVTRGYQALLIRQCTNVPVVELKMTAQEIGLLLQRAKKLTSSETPHIALLSFRNMMPDLSRMGELFGVRLDVRYVEQSEDVGTVLHEFRKDRPDVVIGGLLTCEAAQKQGYMTLFLESTQESMKEAMLTARHLAQTLESQKLSEAQFETVLDASFGGIIRVNREGEIIVANRIVENLLERKNSELVGESIRSAFPEIDYRLIERILHRESDQISTSVHVRNSSWMVLMAPIEYDDQVTGAILSLRRGQELAYTYSRSEHEALLRGYVANVTFRDLQAKSPAMKKVLENARMFALSDRPVTIQLQNGMDAGKLAKAIHNNSYCKAGPFVSLDLKAIEPGDQSDALFKRGGGEEAGELLRSGLPAAQKSGAPKSGAMLLANHGTIWLKNVEYLTPFAQHQIVRMLQPMQMIRTDAQRIDSLSVRLIVSTHTDPAVLYKQGVLDPDFYYMISALQLTIPKLRERREDLRQLFEEQLGRNMKKYNKYLQMTQGGWKAVEEFPWEGNELQLEMFAERLVLSAQKRRIDEIVIRKLYHLMYPEVSVSDGEPRYVVYESREAEKIREVLRRHGGNRQEAARELGVSTTTLWRYMKKFGIEKYE